MGRPGSSPRILGTDRALPLALALARPIVRAACRRRGRPADDPEVGGVRHEAGGERAIEGVLPAMQRRLVTAVVVGLLAFGVPSSRSMTVRIPPALVRVQVGPSAGAEAWRQFFEPLRAELN
jgi:hypothetical protein